MRGDILGGGLGRTVGVDADGGGEGGEEFYVDDDSGDGCGDGAGGGLALQMSGRGFRGNAHEAPRRMTPVTPIRCLTDI